MNVRLEFTTSVLAGVHWQDSVLFNNYWIHLNMITVTTDHMEQNVALERAKYILYNCVKNSVFVDAKEKTAIKRLEAAGAKVIPLPAQPVDQIVGMMLFCKLNAVMEGRLLVTQLKVSSEVGDDIVYCQDDSENMGPFDAKGYWSFADPICTDLKHHGKVVSLSTVSKWQSLDLQWNQEEESEPTTTNIVAFRKDDKE